MKFYFDMQHHMLQFRVFLSLRKSFKSLFWRGNCVRTNQIHLIQWLHLLTQFTEKFREKICKRKK